MPTIALTDTTLRTACLPPVTVTKEGNAKPYEFYWDQQTDGLGVRVRPDGSKDFIFQRKLPGTSKSVRSVIGRFGELTLAQARSKAKAMHGKVIEGVNPVAAARERAAASLPKTWQLFTLREAIAAHVANMIVAKDSPASILQIQRELEGTDEFPGHLRDWLDTPLIDLFPPDDNSLIVNRFRQLSKKNGRRGGPVIANRVMRSLRACLNSAREIYKPLPHWPKIRFHKEERKRSPIPWSQLPAFVAAVDALDNGVRRKGVRRGIRRDLQWVLLLTGSRVTAVCELRWRDVDFDARTIRFVKVKGGEGKAFKVPASAYLLALLLKRKTANAKQGFPTGPADPVFPSRNKAGEVVPIQEPKENTYSTDADGKMVKRFFHQFESEHGKMENASPHRLRDTFITACKAARVDPFTTKLLVNHALPNGDVTEGYAGGDEEHTRACVERVTAFLLMKAGVKVDEGEVDMSGPPIRHSAIGDQRSVLTAKPNGTESSGPTSNRDERSGHDRHRTQARALRPRHVRQRREAPHGVRPARAG